MAYNRPSGGRGGRGRRTRPMGGRNPRNAGLNRAASLRGNNRNIGANRPFQGGLALNEGGPEQPGVSPQQDDMRCPVGQRPGVGPGGRKTCVPDAEGNQGRVGAGIPGPNLNGPNRSGY